MSVDGASRVEKLDPVALRRFLDGPDRDVREYVRAVLRRPEFAKPQTPRRPPPNARR
jgi:hypothetical protein